MGEDWSGHHRGDGDEGVGDLFEAQDVLDFLGEEGAVVAEEDDEMAGGGGVRHASTALRRMFLVKEVLENRRVQEHK